MRMASNCSEVAFGGGGVTGGDCAASDAVACCCCGAAVGCADAALEHTMATSVSSKFWVACKRFRSLQKLVKSKASCNRSLHFTFECWQARRASKQRTPTSSDCPSCAKCRTSLVSDVYPLFTDASSTATPFDRRMSATSKYRDGLFGAWEICTTFAFPIFICKS